MNKYPSFYPLDMRAFYNAMKEVSEYRTCESLARSGAMNPQSTYLRVIFHVKINVFSLSLSHQLTEYFPRVKFSSLCTICKVMRPQIGNHFAKVHIQISRKNSGGISFSGSDLHGCVSFGTIHYSIAIIG